MKNTYPCIFCKKNVTGRSDKKFCSDHCRSEYNNQKKRTDKTDYSVNRINRILIENRQILSTLAEKNTKVHVSYERLVMNGFHFNFYTHTVKVKESLKYFCYDIGYIRRGSKIVIISKEVD